MQEKKLIGTPVSFKLNPSEPEEPTPSIMYKELQELKITVSSMEKKILVLDEHLPKTRSLEQEVFLDLEQMPRKMIGTEQKRSL